MSNLIQVKQNLTELVYALKMLSDRSRIETTQRGFTKPESIDAGSSCSPSGCHSSSFPAAPIH